MKLLVPVFGLLALGATARAGSLKAHLECTPDGGTVLKAKQKLALDKDIACSVIVDGGSVPADAKVAIDAKVTTPLGAVKGHPKDASSPDGKTYTADRLRAGGDFLPCGGLQIDAAIVQGAKTLWSGSVAVQSSCAAPKQITAKLSCSADSADGYVSYPGNGDTLKPQLDQGVTCTIVGPEGDTDAHFGVLAVHGATGPASISVMGVPSGAKAPLMFNQFTAAQVPKCKGFVVDGAVLDKSGAPIWQGKLAVAQSCKKPK